MNTQHINQESSSTASEQHNAQIQNQRSRLKLKHLVKNAKKSTINL
jgi:hypothetical protein